MEPQYWLGRWKRGETGWHQTDVEPNLAARFADLKPTRVFVPLCGKSLDLLWLAAQGHEVLGVELSEAAIRDFLAENKQPFKESAFGAFKRFEGEKVDLLCGDFFDLTPEQLSDVGAVYDRAALIALPPEMRARYAAHMIRLLEKVSAKPGFRFLQIVLERTPHDDQGPPHSVPRAELERLYGSRFKVTPVSREAVDMGGGSESKTEECVYELTLR